MFGIHLTVLDQLLPLQTIVKALFQYTSYSLNVSGFIKSPTYKTKYNMDYYDCLYADILSMQHTEVLKSFIVNLFVMEILKTRFTRFEVGFHRNVAL